MKWAGYKERRDRFIGRGWGWCSWLLLCILVFSVGWPSDIPVANGATGSYSVRSGSPTFVKWSGTMISFWFGSGAGGSGGRYGSGLASVATSWGGSFNAGSHMWTIGDVVGTEYQGWYNYYSGTMPGAGSPVWISVGSVTVGDEGYWATCYFPGNYYAFNMPNDNNTWYSWASVNGNLPLEVAISGSDNVSVGTSYTFDADITGGTGPYSVQFERSSSAHPADDLVYAVQSGAGTTWHQVMTFPNVDNSYLVQVTVTDAESATSTDYMSVNASADRPVFYGQLERQSGSTWLYFGMSGTDPDAGIVPWAECEPTANYTVTAPTIAKTTATSIALLTWEPFPDPLVVYVTYTSPLNHAVWNYVFTFDTSTLLGGGDWVDSGGDTGTGAEEVPTWLQPFLNGLKAALQWLWERIIQPALQALFVPTEEQLDVLLPTGAIGNTLLDGTAWDTGASTWVMHTHWDGKQIDLVDVDFMELGTFGTVVKALVQAAMCFALVYLVVVLI